MACNPDYDVIVASYLIIFTVGFLVGSLRLGIMNKTTPQVKESSMTDPDILDLIKKVETIRSEPGDAKEYEEYTDGWIDACNSVLDLLHSGLAQPEPQWPTDEELRDLWSWAAGQDQGPWPTQQHCFARAVLQRWGHPTSEENLND
jgi:hypothetical protein